jgi:hypothetical protein
MGKILFHPIMRDERQDMVDQYIDRFIYGAATGLDSSAGCDGASNGALIL